MEAGFLILHGLAGSGPGHWQRWLGQRLREAGHEVRFPDLPAPDRPDPQAWREAVLEEVARLREGGVVLCHSLACIAFLDAARSLPRPVGRLALVAPPAAESGVAEIQPFFPLTATAQGVARAAAETLMICSDDDPYCPGGAAGRYAHLRVRTEVLPGRGHLNADAGLGPWPAIEAWAYGAKNGVDT